MSGHRDKLSEFVLLFMLFGHSAGSGCDAASRLERISALRHCGPQHVGYRLGVLSTGAGARHGVDDVISHDARIVFIYALRRMPRLLLFAVPLNLTMILSTPTQGGQYLADEFAGLLLSALSIAALKRCMHVLATRNFGNVAKRAVYSRVAPIDSVPRCAWPGSAWIARIARRLMGKRRPEQGGAAV
ncbi:hypothetical protein QF000_003090 [Paraburkholderia atlantica]|uniref:hypothetical protein n=1 Tax=Paraburkholderia atlantica TaxID=2654982 RepID=UPI003D216793